MSTSLQALPEGSALRLVFPARLDAGTAAMLWREAHRAADGAGRIVLDAAAVRQLDAAGAALLVSLDHGAAEWREPREAGARSALERFRQGLGQGIPAVVAPKRLPPIRRLGAGTLSLIAGGGERLRFFGEMLLGALALLPRPRRFRWAETLRHLDEAGTRAFPLCILLGTLIGVILAFQSSIPMRQYGAEIFISQLVGISLSRELGPLMAAVILAGRTGSAYAAELGTMRVNEEVDALRIMGLDPMAWLVLPRVLAATLVMPVLALVMTVTGIGGMAMVMAGLGYGWPAVASQLKQWMSVGDVVGGLAKAAAFGAAIGMIGCRAGLSAGRGPRAVGDAATAAVVGGIVALVVLDGIFAVLFFRLGW
jgi:phospholipid/cholesterol/gamma-HCH transport system permease protein